MNRYGAEVFGPVPSRDGTKNSNRASFASIPKRARDIRFRARECVRIYAPREGLIFSASCAWCEFRAQFGVNASAFNRSRFSARQAAVQVFTQMLWGRRSESGGRSGYSQHTTTMRLSQVARPQAYIAVLRLRAEPVFLPSGLHDADIGGFA
jgi:hypothetical protein